MSMVVKKKEMHVAAKIQTANLFSTTVGWPYEVHQGGVSLPIWV